MKILVVEDDPVQRGVIAATLGARGDTVIAVDSGEAAVEIVTSGAHHFDSVLMDQKMPGIGGAEAIRRIRTLPDWRGQVPIVAMSAGDVPGGQAIDGILGKEQLARVQEIMVDAAAAAQERVIADQQPPRAVLVNWMKLNLVFLIGLSLTLIGSIAGGIWGASAWNSDQRHQNIDVNSKLEGGQKAMVDVDRRLNELAASQNALRREADATLANARRETDANLANARRETDANLAAAREEIAVLKAQYTILANRAQQQPPPPLLPSPGHRP